MDVLPLVVLDLYGGDTIMNENIGRLIKEAQERTQEVCIWGAGYIGTHFGLQMLKKRGIHVDYYCDSNPSLWGTEVAEGIRCISPKEIKGRNVICFVMVSNQALDIICDYACSIGVKNVVTYNDLCELEADTYYHFKSRKQIAAYTCIVGDYDRLEEPLSISDECDYYVISDKKDMHESIFKYIDIEDCIPRHIEDNVRKNRYCKINAHNIFPQYRYSVYFDGSIRLKKNLSQKVHELPSTRIMALAENPVKCLYIDAMRAAEQGRDTKEILMKQVEKYWLDGMPEYFGSVLCGVLIREHNNPVCRKLMDEWWEQVEQFSRRDQVSFPYVIWKNGYGIGDVATVNGKKLFSDKYLLLERYHAKPRYTVGDK